MSCPICELPKARVQAINKHISEGKRSLMAIAERYKVEVADLREHMVACTEEPTSEAEALQQAQRQLSALIASFQDDISAGRHYEFDQEAGIDGRGVINHYITAMREQRETILAIHKLRTSDEVFNDLQDNVVGPLISAVTAITVQESKRLREEIFDLTKSLPDQHPRIATAVNAFLERVADRMADEALHDIPEKVKAIVTNKKSNPRTPQQH